MIDVLFVADPRFNGGASTALASEIVACGLAGLSCRLLMVKGPVLRLPWPMHAEVEALVASGACPLVDPSDWVRARHVIVHHPTLFSNLPDRPLQVEGDSLVLVLHHPAVDGLGAREYDLRSIVETMSLVFARTPLLAPVGPAVRRSLRGLDLGGAPLMDRDWHNLIDVDAWPTRADRAPRFPVVIGRHSRPSPLKWPDDRPTALEAYPADERFRVRMLGADAGLLAERYGPLPSNWETIPFAGETAPDFLRDLDFYVYYHSDAWIEAFGRSILEALACGLVAILPPSFRELFGPAAVYGEPHEVRSIIAEFVAEPDAYRLQARRAREHCRATFGLERLAERLTALEAAGSSAARDPAAAPPRVGLRPSPARVLMITSNGIGLGHLTRLLAIARRLPSDIEPVFFTLSQAMKIVVEAGYLAEFLPFHAYTRVDVERWNRVLAEELHDAIAFYRPRAIVFDGNVPHTGLVDAIAEFPRVHSTWVRRAMWTDGHGFALKRSHRFDAVLEPADIADMLDTGPTVAERGRTFRVDPILLVDPADRHSREEARRLLDLPPDARVVGVQLGAGNNFDMDRIRRKIIGRLLEDPGAHVVEIVSPIRDHPVESIGDRHRVASIYPSFPFSTAFDFMVSAAGYNSFHEAILGHVPTLFVPNEAGEMDLQIVRAQYADLAGCGMLLRTVDTFNVDEALKRMSDSTSLDAMKRRCSKIGVVNGAGIAAAFLTGYSRMVRSDQSFARRYA